MLGLKAETGFIIQEWCNEVGKPISMGKCRDNVLCLYTLYPGYFIGRHGSLFDKYKQQLIALSWEEVKLIELKETFTPGRDYSDTMKERAKAFWELEGQFILGENFENA